MPMPEFGGDGVEYFSPFDPADIARAMTRVLKDRGHANYLSTQAISLASRYNWKSTATQTWKCILGLVKPLEKYRA
jgi:glycosyltransferase involved in cell wall biosynthesis